MIYPTIAELTKNEFNRYQLTLATAKCARLITEKYVKQRVAAEASLIGNKEGSATIGAMIDPKLANEKAVKNAIEGLKEGQYAIVDAPVAEDEESTVED